MIYFGTQSPLKERLQIFQETLSQMTTDFGTWNTPWGEINRYQRLNGDPRQAFNDSLPSIGIGMASGRWGALAAYGARYTNNTKKIYGTRGNSFVAVVSFGERLQAKSILAGGKVETLTLLILMTKRKLTQTSNSKRFCFIRKTY